jgi:hypothetical protein
VPAKQRLGRHDRANFAKHFPPDCPRLRGKLPALGVGEDDAPFPEPVAKQAVLGSQVLDHRRLLPVKKTGDQDEQELKQRRASRHFGRDVGCTTPPPSTYGHQSQEARSGISRHAASDSTDSRIFAFLIVEAAIAQDASKLVGGWKLVSVK